MTIVERKIGGFVYFLFWQLVENLFKCLHKEEESEEINCVCLLLGF